MAKLFSLSIGGGQLRNVISLEPSPLDAGDDALNADTTATNWGCFISARRATPGNAVVGEIGEETGCGDYRFSEYFARARKKLWRNDIDPLYDSKKLD